MGLEGGGLALDSGGRVGDVSILVGGIKAAASDCLTVGMSSASSPPLTSVASVQGSGCRNFFQVARVAQLRASILIFYKDSIALLFHHFVWYWLKVGGQFAVTALVEQDAISFNNITVLG